MVRQMFFNCWQKVRCTKAKIVMHGCPVHYRRQIILKIGTLTMTMKQVSALNVNPLLLYNHFSKKPFKRLLFLLSTIHRFVFSSRAREDLVYRELLRKHVLPTTSCTMPLDQRFVESSVLIFPDFKDQRYLIHSS